MNRRRWAAVAAAASVLAVLAVVVGVSLLSDGSRPAGSGSPGREELGFDAAYPDPDPMVLVVRYGDSSSCPSKAVRHVVRQEPDRIVVTLTRTPMPGDRACTSDYGARLVRVPLNAPLGSRTVLDGSRQKQVPISTGTPPFG